MSREYLDFVEDIPDAMDKAEIPVEGFAYSEFEADFRTNFALVGALEIIGEATKRLPMSLREQYPDIPWRGMAGMRDRISHGYDTVDLQIVWDVVKQDISRIRPQIQKVLADHPG
jgi:uncharacterized protein with HEPN domain